MGESSWQDNGCWMCVVMCQRLTVVDHLGCVYRGWGGSVIFTPPGGIVCQSLPLMKTNEAKRCFGSKSPPSHFFVVVVVRFRMDVCKKQTSETENDPSYTKELYTIPET